MPIYQKLFSVFIDGESVRSGSAKKLKLFQLFGILFVFLLALMSSAASAQSQTSISPSQQSFPALEVNERVVRNFQFTIAQGESVDSVEFCVPNCTNPADRVGTNVFPIGGSTVNDASGGASWGFQYRCPSSANTPRNCDAQVVFIPSSPGTYSAEFQVNSQTILFDDPGNTRRSISTSVFDQTGTAVLTGTLAEPPERGVIQFSPTSYTVDEDAGTVTLTVERTGGSDGAVSVTASTEDGSALAGEDYAATSVSRDWGAGQMGLRMFTIPIVADTTVEQDSTSTEFFTVSLSVASEADSELIGENSSATVTINNVDPEPSGFIRFVVDSDTVAEDAEFLNVSVERVNGSNGVLSVSYSTPGNTAVAGEDYTNQSDDLTWIDGDTVPQNITIPILMDNNGSEGDETFSVVLSNQEVIQITITDVPPLPSGEIQFDRASYTVAEDAQSITVNLDRVGGSQGALNIDFFTENGSAQAGSDYTSTSGGRDWENDDSRRQSITIPILTDNNTEEGNEDFFIELSNGERARVVITDDQPIQSGVIQFNPVSYSPSESTGLLTIEVTRTGGDDGEITVRASTLDGTAEAGSDYTARTVDLTWDENDSENKTFTVPILSDNVEEPTESFSISLSLLNSEDLSLIGANDIATVNITDVPPANSGTIQFAPVNYQASENDGEVTLTMTREGGDDGSISVLASTADGSAQAGSDYTSRSERITWENNDSDPKTITVAILSDGSEEVDENFSVSLTDVNDAGESVVGTDSLATVTIADVPPPRAGTIQFTVAAVSIDENDGPLLLDVSRMGGSAGASSVTVEVAASTATQGEDFRFQPTTLTWDNNDAETQQVSIPIIFDTATEEAENFTVRLIRGSDSAAALGTPSSVSVTINNIRNGSLGTLQFTEAAASVDEDSSEITLNVTRTGGSDEAVSVSYSVIQGTATAGDDYINDSGLLLWTDGDMMPKVIRIAIREDALPEANETFIVALGETQPLGNNEQLGTPNRVTVTIVNVDPEITDPVIEQFGTLEISQEEYSTTEDEGSVSIVVNRINGSDGAISVQYQTASDSAEAGSDFTSLSGELNWADGDALPKQFTVLILDDAESEENEQFTVTLLNPQANSDGVPELGRSTASVTIEDSTNVGQIRFVTAGFSGSEADGQVALDVERIGGDDGLVSVDYRLENDSAIAGEDYVAASGSLSWNDGETGIKTIVVQLIADSRNEMSEQFRAVLDNALPLGAVQITRAEARVEILDSTIPPSNPTPFFYQLEIVSGDNQSVLPGDSLEPLVLQASLIQSAIGSIEGLTVNWRVQPEGAAEFENGNQTVTDASGRASNQVNVTSRGFVRVIASVVAPEVTGKVDQTNLRIRPPPIELPSNEIAFTVRAGLFAAIGLNNNQAQTGQALDSACEALDGQVDVQIALTAEQQDLLLTCRELENRLADGTLTPALDRLAPEELFTLGDSVIDTTDLQITNVYSRINAIRSGRIDSLDVSGLNFDVRGQNIPGSVVQAALNQFSSGGGAAADNVDIGSPLSVFVNGSLSVGEVDGDLNQRSADISTSGLTIGIDYRLTANTVIGTGLGITDNETEFSPDDGGVDTSAVNLTVYGTYYREAAGYADVVLDIGRNEFDVRRRIDLPGNDRRFAFGDTSADVIALTLGAGFDKAIGAFEFGPYGRLSYISADVGSYQEQADSAGEGFGSVLSVEAHSVRSTTVSIGAQLSRIISTKRGVFVPQLRVEAEFESVDKKDGIQATFQHDPDQNVFEIAGNPRDESYINIGLGSSVLLPNGKTGFIFYETRTQHDFVTQHWLKLGVRIEF